MAWLILVVAGLFEVVWVFSMKRSEGFTRLWPSVVTLAAMLASFGLLAWSMRSLPLGTAYAVWTGIGAVGAFVAGVFFLGEAANAPRLIAASLIVGGLLLMKLSSPAYGLGASFDVGRDGMSATGRVRPSRFGPAGLSRVGVP